MYQNNLYKITQKLLNRLKLNGFKQVSLGTEKEIDFTNRQSGYPFAHIVIPSGSNGKKVTKLNFTLIVGDKVDPTGNEFSEYGKTNSIDILQDLLVRVQTTIDGMDRKYLTEQDSIEIGYVTDWDMTFEPFVEDYPEALSGYICNISFSMPNMLDDLACVDYIAGSVPERPQGFGTSGTSGTSGKDGQTYGTSGVDGTSGTSGVDGSAGVIGTSGNDGTSGSSGVDGVIGTSGSSGSSGVDGTSGLNGNDGMSGSSGVDGLIGTSGSSGSSGVDGTSGSSGVDGTSGSSGVDGLIGTSGSSGSSGVDGLIGTSGSSGSSGLTGSSGVSGTSGLNGNDGMSGSSGLTGTSGVNGTSGSSGVNGTSGVNGNIGTSGLNGNDGTSGSSGLSLNPNELINLQSTGILYGGVLQIPSTGSTSTYFNITDGMGYIIDNHTDPLNPIKTIIVWSGLTGITQEFTYTDGEESNVAIDKNGNVFQQIDPFTIAQKRHYIVLGTLGHYDDNDIDYVIPEPMSVVEPMVRLDAFLQVLGPFNVEGNVFFSNGSNLKINKTAGQTFDNNNNYWIDRITPSIVTSQLIEECWIQMYYRSGTSWLFGDYLQTVDPAHWDDGSGTLALTPSTGWTIQTIFYYSPLDLYSQNVDVQYGQKIYNSKEQAVAGITTIIDLNEYLSNNTFRCWLITRGDSTDLSDTTQCTFIAASKFGLGGGITGTGSGGGLATASNIGSAGQGLFHDKLGVDLRFKNINAYSGLTIIDNIVNNTLDIYLTSGATNGTSGSSGVDGASGSSGVSGTSGVDGASGSSGVSGTSGVDGASGTSGVDGASGSSGVSGTSGSSGLNGTSGSSGLTGTSGSSGVDGSSGSSGVDGTSGVSGSSGSSGVNGLTGTSGSSGVNGTSGFDGTSGSSGVSGTSGVDGASGSSGVNGTSGSSGLTGTSGSSGVDGASGSSGVNGTSGVNGLTGNTYTELSYDNSTQILSSPNINTTTTLSASTSVITGAVGLGRVLGYIKVVSLSADTTTGPNVTPVILTNLNFSYVANATYLFKIIGSMSSAAATTGMGLQLDVSSVVTSQTMQFYHQLATTGTITGGYSVSDNFASGVTSGAPAINSIIPFVSEGLLITGANAGTGQFYYRSETTAATTCKVGTTLLVQRIL